MTKSEDTVRGHSQTPRMAARDTGSTWQAVSACMRSVRGPEATDPPLAGRLGCRLGRYGASAALSDKGHRQQPGEHLDGREQHASAATASAPVGLGQVGG